MAVASETQQEHFQRRRRDLEKKSKPELCSLYRQLGGLGGVHPPEKWRKDEVVSSIVEIEWSRLPEDQKQPNPPRLTPPCDTCGQGENAGAHRYGGEHHYVYTHNPDAKWVPESEEEAKRIQELGAAPAPGRLDGCSAHEDPDGETMCVCDSIAAEPTPDPREEEECQAEFIDGSWYGDGCDDCNHRVQAEGDDCETCQEEEYCSRHANGIYA